MARITSRDLFALAFAAGLLAACSPTTASGQGTTSTTSGKSVTTSTIPAGTTLRVGDQLNYLSTVLKVSHEDTGFSYTVQYSQFIGGPPMLQAFQGNQLDTGFVGSTPLIFAQAANQPLSAVAAWGGKGSGYGLVTAPGNSSVTSWKSLKGKSVAYQQGTAGEAVLLQGLQSAGLTLGDITSVNLPQTQISAALEGGSADAAISVEPLTSVYLAANPTAKQVETASDITARTNFLISSSSAISTPGTSAALADYLVRLVKAFNYLRSHPDAALAVFVNQYHVTPARAAQLRDQVGVSSFVPIPGVVAPAQQQLADLFAANGQIPNKINVTSEFDPRFNQLIQSVQHG